VGWTVALWLGLVTLSSSAQLHQLLHADAQTLNHECLLTSVAKDGKIEVAPGYQLPEPHFYGTGQIAVQPASVSSFSDLRLAYGRAPPVGFIASN
jgi:hypothetical protein